MTNKDLWNKIFDLTLFVDKISAKYKIQEGREKHYGNIDFINHNGKINDYYNFFLADLQKKAE